MSSRHSPPPPRPGQPATGPASAGPRPARQALLVGRKIRKLRKERRLDQATLAAMVGMQPADVAGIEKGEYRISLDVLFRLLEVFQASISDFIEDGSGAPPARQVPFPVRGR